MYTTLKPHQHKQFITHLRQIRRIRSSISKALRRQFVGYIPVIDPVGSIYSKALKLD